MSESTPQDYVDMLGCLSDAGCDFIVVGAYALAFNGYARATADIDILVRAEAMNAQRVVAALRAFGAPVQAHGVEASDFEVGGNVYQIGLPPVRIDLLTSISGVSYDEIERGCGVGTLGEVEVRFIGIDEQIQNKRSTGRLKDLADVEALEALKSASS